MRSLPGKRFDEVFSPGAAMGTCGHHVLTVVNVGWIDEGPISCLFLFGAVRVERGCTIVAGIISAPPPPSLGMSFPHSVLSKKLLQNLVTQKYVPIFYPLFSIHRDTPPPPPPPGHLGAVQAGTRSGDPLCQCRSLSIGVTRECPMQVDGEPCPGTPDWGGG